jgi:hypothetical protein
MTSIDEAFRLAEEWLTWSAYWDSDTVPVEGELPTPPTNGDGPLTTDKLARALLELRPVCVAAARLVAANRLHGAGGTNPLKRATDSAVLGSALAVAIDALTARGK